MKSIDQLSDDQLLHALHAAVADLPDVPAALERRALDLFAPAPSALAQVAASGLRLLTAVLSFDSFATSAVAMGVRGMASTTRHLLYTSQGRDIDLRIAPAAEAYAVAGQILGPDETGTIALARDGGGATLQAELDDLGSFRIEGVAPGTWQMTLTVGGDQIVLPPLDIGPKAGPERAD